MAEKMRALREGPSYRFSANEMPKCPHCGGAPMTGEKDAPAEMPGERELALAIKRAQMGDRAELSKEGPWLDFELRSARAAQALFAPILAEKERAYMRRWTAALSQAQEWRNLAEKAEARALAAEAALAAKDEQLQIALAALKKIDEGCAAALRAQGE